jgi:hypothetical protein
MIFRRSILTLGASFLSLLMFAMPLISYGACYLGTSFSTSPDDNGTYEPDGGTAGGFPTYINENNVCLFAKTGDDYWRTRSAGVCADGAIDSYYLTAGTGDPSGFPYIPDGVIAPTTCPGGGGGGSATTSTSSVAITNVALLGSISFGISVLIFIGFLIVIGLVYNGMSKKKKWQF